MNPADERHHFANRIQDLIASLSWAANALAHNSNTEAGYVAEKALALSRLADELREFEASRKA